MNVKLLTVIVPSYNMEKYLRACLDSVLSDNPMADRLDVIVVNDGSSDGTSAIAHEFKAVHPGIVRIIDKENGNYGSCVNAGLREAQGLYVKILDADDTFDTPAFVRYLGFLDQLVSDGNEPDAVFNDFVEVDPDGNVLKTHFYALVDEPGFSLARFDCREGRYVWMHSLAYRTELLRTIGYRQTEGIFYTDQEWSGIPMLHARKIRRCPETVYRYLVGRQGQTCEEPVRLKHFAMHFPVATAIVRAYETAKANAFPESNLECANSQIKSLLRLFYRTHLVASHRSLDDAALARFDQFLKETDEALYRYPDGFVVTLGHFSFRYVREWRKRMSRQTIRFWLLDLKQSLRRLAKQLFRRSVSLSRNQGMLP